MTMYSPGGDVHLAEVWCSRCDQPSTMTVGESAYCARHGADALWRANSPSMNPERTIPSGRCSECGRRVLMTRSGQWIDARGARRCLDDATVHRVDVAPPTESENRATWGDR